MTDVAAGIDRVGPGVRDFAGRPEIVIGVSAEDTEPGLPRNLPIEIADDAAQPVLVGRHKATGLLIAINAEDVRPTAIGRDRIYVAAHREDLCGRLRPCRQHPIFERAGNGTSQVDKHVGRGRVSRRVDHRQTVLGLINEQRLTAAIDDEWTSQEMQVGIEAGCQIQGNRFGEVEQQPAVEQGARLDIDRVVAGFELKGAVVERNDGTGDRDGVVLIPDIDRFGSVSQHPDGGAGSDDQCVAVPFQHDPARIVSAGDNRAAEIHSVVAVVGVDAKGVEGVGDDRSSTGHDDGVVAIVDLNTRCIRSESFDEARVGDRLVSAVGVDPDRPFALGRDRTAWRWCCRHR